MSDDVERNLRNVVESMRIEGFEVTEETKQIARGILKGELDADNEVAKIVEEYKATARLKGTGTE